MSMKDKQRMVRHYLRDNPEFARDWFRRHAPVEWAQEVIERSSEPSHSPERESGRSTVRGDAKSRNESPCHRCGCLCHEGAFLSSPTVPLSRGSITSDIFYKHVKGDRVSVGPSPIAEQRLSNLQNEVLHWTEREIFIELIKDIAGELDVNALCHKILCNVSILTNSDRGSLFLARGKPGSRYLVSKLFDVTSGSTLEKSLHGMKDAIRVPFGVGIAGHVAETKETVNIKDCYKDPRFNQRIDQITGYRTHSMLCKPILNHEGGLIGVAQIINKKEGDHEFTPADDRVFENYLTFCGIGLTNAQLFEISVEEYRRNRMLLRLARDIFKEQTNMDQLISTIMEESAKLLRCQRCIVYLLDEHVEKPKVSRPKPVIGTPQRTYSDLCEEQLKRNKKNQLKFVKVFQLMNSAWKDTVVIGDTAAADDTWKVEEIELQTLPASLTKVALSVAESGELVNIEDFQTYSITPIVPATDDDQLISVLSIPIRNSDNNVTGVAQLTNKLNGHPFSESDINIFETFTIFCGLGIHNCQMYENVRRLMMKQSVALEVLSYHACASKEEADKLLSVSTPNSEYFKLYKWDFDDLLLTDEETLQACVRMFIDSGLVKEFKIPQEVLVRWVCSVKKNYRQVTYHNWRHAFNVAQTMFTVCYTANVKKYMTSMELLALLVACLCHDMDHRGTNNSFQIKVESPLAKLYTTSTMEYHHFDQCVMILNSEGNNIFVSLSHDQYRQIINFIRIAILSTDLAIYFKKRDTFRNLVNDIGSDRKAWVSDDTRKELLSGMLMTACDLAAITKPWHIQYKVAHLVASEFFEQGDIEREKLNEQPIPMMDRMKQDELPNMQVGFINFICMPLYEILSKFCDKTHPLLDGCSKNKDNWTRLSEIGKQGRDWRSAAESDG